MTEEQFNKPRLSIGSEGWTHLQWNQDYYPEDMPAEWRLDFYSHHFSCLLMQSQEWLTASEQQMIQWGDDVKDDFDFFMRVSDVPTDKAIAQLEKIKGHLGSRFKGLVFSFAVSCLDKAVLEKLASFTELCIDVDDQTTRTDAVSQCWRAQRQVTHATIGFIDLESSKNIRAMRAQLENFLQQSPESQLYLFFDGGAPNPSRMQEAQVIYQLIS